MASTQQRCNHSITRLSLEGSEQTLSITQQILEHHIISEHGLHVITRLSVRNSLNPNLNWNAFACPVAPTIYSMRTGVVSGQGEHSIAAETG
jgi:hypothetical protein